MDDRNTYAYLTNIMVFVVVVFFFGIEVIHVLKNKYKKLAIYRTIV